ncbi:hypothetical protein T07_9454 [Trichinella nelsoni]|uniref:Uncharacterized protein n=1 Tax=Trichinella nelsoni TaxID=6336 RepID=A0A0V0S270_9BILA|nr:hypothetical protein T07_9454 [Trichinella nelsoni]
MKIEEAEPFLRQLGRAKQLPPVENKLAYYYYYYYYYLLTLALSSCCLARSSKSCLVISRSRSSSNDKSLELSESFDV